MASVQNWVSDHKLTSVASLWAAAIGASLAMSSKRASPLTPSLKIIHARVHAQAATLGVLAGSATLHYTDWSNVLAGGISAPSSGSPFEDYQYVTDWM